MTSRALSAPIQSEPRDLEGRGSVRAVAVGCVLGALVLVVLDAAIANVSLPAVADALRVTPAEAVHAVSAYQLALVSALLPCAALGEALGHRRVYAAGIAVFVFASVLCALAPSLPHLVAARALQGLGGAAVMSLGVALLRAVVPERMLGRAIGWNALAVALATAAGPTVSALLLSRLGYRWLFALDLPLGALILLATRALPDVRGNGRGMDVVSAALYAIAFASLVSSAGLAPSHAAAALLVLTLGALCAVLVVRRELPKKEPLIPFDLLRARPFRISVIASICCFVGQSAAMVSLPFYLKRSHHLDALRAGFVITLWPIGVALAAPLAGRLVERVSGGVLCALGGALLALGLASSALMTAHAGAAALAPCIAACGAGFGLFQVPNNRSLFLSAPRERSGAAGGMQGTARLTGQTLGASLMTLLFATMSMDVAPRLGLAVAAAFTLVAGLVSLMRSLVEAHGQRGAEGRGHQ